VETWRLADRENDQKTVKPKRFLPELFSFPMVKKEEVSDYEPNDYEKEGHTR
jgi:hypothetical protein